MSQSSMNYRASQAYRSAAVSVPPLRAVVMLHSGAITLLRRSIEAQEGRRFEEGHDCLTRATAILRGLSHHLDSRRSGPMGDRLFETYNALVLAAHRAYGRPHATRNFQRIITAVTELREAWEFVEAQTRGAVAAGA
ncbi:flagellar export chaperone FliS [Rhodopseudomonas sp. B29]|uniref:flagellar export chaperone FliS n=1 Tax=Rhodopseudomonas sp. B29 TaxID=95607 RepID=UPI0003B7BB76|nr:flagellar export chaperone FliS [Rhodopseudomonas sp. B29]